MRRLSKLMQAYNPPRMTESEIREHLARGVLGNEDRNGGKAERRTDPAPDNDGPEAA